MIVVDWSLFWEVAEPVGLLQNILFFPHHVFADCKWRKILREGANKRKNVEMPIFRILLIG